MRTRRTSSTGLSELIYGWIGILMLKAFLIGGAVVGVVAAAVYFFTR